MKLIISAIILALSLPVMAKSKGSSHGKNYDKQGSLNFTYDRNRYAPKRHRSY